MWTFRRACFTCFSVLLLLQGCGTVQPISGFEQLVDKQDLFPLFTEPVLSRFDMSVEVLGKHHSGMLLVKPNGEGLYRVVFTAYTGPTLMDMTFGPGESTVHQVVDELNNRRVIKVFSVLFETLFLSRLPASFPARVAALSDSLVLTRMRSEGRFYAFQTRMDAKQLMAIQSGRGASRMDVLLTDYQEQGPGTLTVRYGSLIKVHLILSRLP